MTPEAGQHGDLGGKPVAAQIENSLETGTSPSMLSLRTYFKKKRWQTHILWLCSVMGVKACALKVKMKDRKTSERPHYPAFPRRRKSWLKCRQRSPVS